MDVRQAVQTAITYVKDLFGEAIANDVRLEEVERSEDNRFWLITIGYSAPQAQRRTAPLLEIAGSLGGLGALASIPLERVYKVVTVDDQTGEVKSVKIRML